jgi:tRNA 2-thiouridine synthesizing protein A
VNFLRTVDNGIQASEILNARELNSLLALFQAKRKIGKLTSGQVLQIDGTDLRSRKDFNKWCDRSGNEYLGEKDMHKYIRFFIKKG